MDDHTKDSKKNPIYQFWLLVTGITAIHSYLCDTFEEYLSNVTVKIEVTLGKNVHHMLLWNLSSF
jgi:hypothetical protein